MRSVTQGALVAGMTRLVLLSYGHLYNVIKLVQVAGELIGRHRFLLSASLGIITATTFVVWRRPNVSRSTAGPLSLALGARVPSDLGRLERMLILNAYYLPEACRQTLYPEITPVNSFRVVFGACMGGDLPLLPDESLFSTYWRL